MGSNNNMKCSRRRVVPHLQYTRGIDVQNVMLQGIVRPKSLDSGHEFLPYLPDIYFKHKKNFTIFDFKTIVSITELESEIKTQNDCGTMTQQKCC